MSTASCRFQVDFIIMWLLYCTSVLFIACYSRRWGQITTCHVRVHKHTGHKLNCVFYCINKSPLTREEPGNCHWKEATASACLYIGCTLGLWPLNYNSVVGEKVKMDDYRRHGKVVTRAMGLSNLCLVRGKAEQAIQLYCWVVSTLSWAWEWSSHLDKHT